RVGSPGSATAAAEGSTDGRSRPWIASCSGSSVPSTHAPSRAIPTGTTSNRSRSRWRSTLPAETQEMACSLLRPPNTTATRTRGTGAVVMGTQRRGRSGRARPGPEQVQVRSAEGAAADQDVDEVASVRVVEACAPRLGHQALDPLAGQPLPHVPDEVLDLPVRPARLG